MEDESTCIEKCISFFKKYDTLIVACIGILAVIIGFCYVSDFFKTYQTLIVGYFGFLGVMWTLKSNARLSLAQHEREIRHQRRRTRVALLQELKLNRDAVERAAAHQSGAEDHMDFWVPVKVMDDIFQSAKDRIVELTPTEIYKVVEVYHTLSADKDKQLLWGNPDGGYGKYILISAQYVSEYAAQQENLLEPIDHAIQALENALA